MCGRFNVIDDPIAQSIMDLLGIKFSVTTNDNVCPSELISTIGFNDSQLVQINASWGIKPDWANRLIINAQSETVETKKTFKNAFLSNRCIIPISGWYEWKNLQNGKKEKYLFSNNNNTMFMAGIVIQNNNDSSFDETVDLFGEPINRKPTENQVVSLTTKANYHCAPIHSRMPLLIHQNKLMNWLSGEAESLINLTNHSTLDITTTSLKA